VDNQQRSPKWIADRWGKITASKFNDVISKTKSGYSASRKNYLAELVIERLTPPPTEDIGYKSESMQFGIDNEPVARLEYELITGNTVDEAFFEQLTEDVGASPDGYVGADGLIEIKCPNTATHIETLKRQDVPKQYIAQIQGQMMVTGRNWCDFISYDPRLPENAQIFIKRVERDQEYIDNLKNELAKFIQELNQEVEFVKSYKE
jgi:putative phage-type endonuclease